MTTPISDTPRTDALVEENEAACSEVEQRLKEHLEMLRLNREAEGIPGGEAAGCPTVSIDTKTLREYFKHARQQERELNAAQSAIAYGRECEQKLNDVTKLYHEAKQLNDQLIKQDEQNGEVLARVCKERGEWKDCAEKLAHAIQEGLNHGYGLRIGEEALSLFNQLNQQSK